MTKQLVESIKTLLAHPLFEVMVSLQITGGASSVTDAGNLSFFVSF